MIRRNQAFYDSRRDSTLTRISRVLLAAIHSVAGENKTTARAQLEKCVLGMDPKASRVLREKFRSPK